MSASNLTATQFPISYALALLVLGALDAAWLGWIAKNLYRREMGALMADSPRVVPAALFYVLYPVALVFFGLEPMKDASVTAAFLRCAAIGLLAYGTYNLTNLSILRGFSVKLACVDLCWGALASGLAGAGAWASLRWWERHA